MVDRTHRGPKRVCTCVRAVPEWRVGKQGSCYRLKGNANSHLLNHVCLALKVQIDLQRPLRV